MGRGRLQRILDIHVEGAVYTKVMASATGRYWLDESPAGEDQDLGQHHV